MSSSAVTLRLREIDRLLALQGVRSKGVDMSPAAVTARLRTLGSLSDMCLRLVEIGMPRRHR
jgi:hypothetical protein